MYQRNSVAAPVLCLFFLFSAAIAGASDIHDAVKSGDLEKVKKLVESNRALLDEKDPGAKTPLHHAIETGNTDIAGYLIEQGADIDLKGKNDEAPLHIAAYMGNSEITRLLLEKGATAINEGNNINNTPLHIACRSGYPEVARVLLDHGADIEAKGEQGATPLLVATLRGQMPMVELLVERGADINASAFVDYRHYTALTLAVMSGLKDFVDYLIDQNVDIHEDILDLTLQYAVRRDYIRLFDYAQEQGSRAAEMIDINQDLIYMAAGSGSIQIIESLVARGLVLNQHDMNGWTPLHHAASRGQMDMVKYLIDKQVDKNTREKRGQTAYHVAALADFPEVAQYLQSIGVDSSEPRCPEFSGPYMGQKPPGDTPEMFMPGIVSGHYRAHTAIEFSPDGAEAYWTQMGPGEEEISGMEVVGGRWTCPGTALMGRDPAFSPDGHRLYFIKVRPFREGERPAGELHGWECIWYIEKTASGWSEPVPVGEAVDAIGPHWQSSIDRQGNLYFSEFKDNMYVSHYIDGRYREPVKLTEQFDNETLIGECPFISPDADYLLFASEGDLYISFKKADSTWTDRISLGDDINSQRRNGSPRVTPDGKYIFFVSSGNAAPWGIYWVSSGIIDRLRTEHL